MSINNLLKQIYILENTSPIMYLIVPSGLMRTMYDGFSKEIHRSTHWINMSTGVWKFVYKWEDATFFLTVSHDAGKKSCTFKIERGDFKNEFEINSMELQEELDENNKPKYASILILKAKDVKSGTEGELFFSNYPLEEKIYQMNKRFVK